jgi:hypothetical protein
VTSADVHLRIRPPAWTRGLLAVFPLLVFAFVRFVLEPEDGGGSWLRSLGAAAFAAVLAWRMGGLQVVGTADGRLVVRNHWSTRLVHRHDIVDVTIGRLQGVPNKSVLLHLRDGSDLRLDVTDGLPLGPNSRMERQVGQVRAWVSGRPQPFV